MRTCFSIRAGEKILRLFFTARECESLTGDFEEAFIDLRSDKGLFRALLWLWFQILKSASRSFLLSIYWRGIMLKNYIKIAMRNFRRQKGYVIINFAGLAIGLAVTLTLTLYIMDDLKFDRFHEDADRIFRILSVGVTRGTVNSIPSGPLVQTFKEDIPEIESATRVTGGGRLRIGRIGTDLRNAEAEGVVRVPFILGDSGFFDVFNFKLLEGASGDALARPGSVFLTPEAAQAVFGEDNPVGQPLAVRGLENAQVVGLVQAPPTTSHIQFDMIIPLIPEANPVWWNNFERKFNTGRVCQAEAGDRTRWCGSQNGRSRF
jgi:putative ABC transport system permease protein